MVEEDIKYILTNLKTSIKVRDWNIILEIVDFIEDSYISENCFDDEEF